MRLKRISFLQQFKSHRMSEHRYIDLSGLGEFKKLISREVDHKLEQSRPSGAGRVRVLHHRMISYYSPPGEVYSVVKRMRIPRVKPGDSFCLKGILPDKYSEYEFMNNTVILYPQGVFNPVGLQHHTRELTSRFLDFDEESQTVTAKDELENVPSLGSGVVLLVETRLKGPEFGTYNRIHGGFNRDRELVVMAEDCARPLRPIMIDGHRRRDLNAFVGAEIDSSLVPEDLDTLKRMGVEVQKLKCCTHKPISPYGPENRYSRDDEREERISDNPGKYTLHLRRYNRLERYQWRWVGCRDNFPERGIVRLRTRRGDEVTPWIFYRIKLVPTRLGLRLRAYITKEPSKMVYR